MVQPKLNANKRLNLKETNDRKRISSNLKGIKIFIGICVLYLTIKLFSDWQEAGFLKMIFPTIGILAVLAGLWYYASTRKQIEFDATKNLLFIIDPKTKIGTEIPLAKIDKIVFSAIGLSLVNFSNYSYVIVYRDIHHLKKKVRLFPKSLSTDVDSLIKAIRKQNPSLETRNWSFGWNELLD